MPQLALKFHGKNNFYLPIQKYSACAPKANPCQSRRQHGLVAPADSIYARDVSIVQKMLRNIYKNIRKHTKTTKCNEKKNDEKTLGLLRCADCASDWIVTTSGVFSDLFIRSDIRAFWYVGNWNFQDQQKFQIIKI